MNDINYWERFLATGSVNDFLSYKNALKDIETVQNADRQSLVGRDRSGEKSHAGLYRDYGNGFKG